MFEEDEKSGRAVYVPEAGVAGFLITPVAYAANATVRQEPHSAGISSESETVSTGTPTDPAVAASQWHLTGLWGTHANKVWGDYTGNGVLVAILDDGFQHTHSELTANYRADIDLDTLGGDNDAMFVGANRHGTAVAGIIAADDNGAGGAGVAFDAQILGIRQGFGAETNLSHTLQAFQHVLQQDADVMNNSWGFTTAFSDDNGLEFTGTDFYQIRDAIIDVTELGRDGLGGNIVFSSGNARASGENVNYHNLQNSPHVITVAAIDSAGKVASFSNPGAAVLISAAGVNVYTTDNTGSDGYQSGDYTNFSGTSASAPVVSGVIALMLDANPDLGWRDVQEILAYSAQHNDAASAGWQVNGAGNWNGGGLYFSHDYGFGAVDAYAAVRLAETWHLQQTSANMISTAAFTASPAIAIPSTGTITTSINIADDIEIEHVLIHLDIDHTKAGDLVVTLISPDGTESVLVNRISNGAFTANPYGHTGIDFDMSSNAHWGESSAGTWNLRIADMASGNAGTLNSWSVSFLGNAHSADDTYIFTDSFGTLSASEHSNRNTIIDADGNDTINLSAMSGNINFSLMSSDVGYNTFAGKSLYIPLATEIENLITGDGNDHINGNDGDNRIYTGRGDDFVVVSEGNDVVDGGLGIDTAWVGDLIANYLFNFTDADSLIMTHLGVGINYGVDTWDNFEFFSFGDGTFSRLMLEAITGNTVLVLPPIAINFDWGSGNYQHISDQFEDLTLTAADIGHGGVGDLIQVSYVTPEITNIPNVNGFTVNYLTADALGALRVDGSAQGEQITLTGAAVNTSAEIYAGAGRDFVEIELNTGDFTIHLGNEDDSVNGGNGIEIVYGEAGNDTIYTNGNDDVIDGGDGNDVVYAGLGNDTIHGGAGDDVIHGEAGDDTIHGGAGHNIIYAGDGNDTIYYNTGDLVRGENGNDTMYGTAGVDHFNGGAGDDALYGYAGIDYFIGEGGDDSIYGGDDADLITYTGTISEFSFDLTDPSRVTATHILGTFGTDTIYDVESFKFGNQTYTRAQIEAYTNNPTQPIHLTFSQSSKTFLYTSTDPESRTFTQANMGMGTSTADHVRIDRTPDGIVVNYLNSAAPGTLRLDGSAIDDSINIAGARSGLIANVYGLGGNDTISLSIVAVGNIYGGDGNDIITGNTQLDNLYGDAGDDILTGGSGNDNLYGGDDRDTLNGGIGNDILNGGNHDDVLNGEAGNDILNGDAGDDTLNGHDGTDILRGGDGVDRLYGGAGTDTLYGGNDNDILSGGTENDILYGDFGNDTLSGDAGTDTLHGGAGDDILDGGDGSDTLNGNDGVDMLTGGAGIDKLYGGNDNDTLNGGTENDTLDGEAGNDILNGDAGNDSLTGGLGDDILNGGDGTDVLNGNDGIDALYGNAGTDTLHGGNGDDTLFGGADNDTLNGDAGNDTLSGETGNDILNGLTGNDILSGGDGTDTLNGGVDNDVLHGGNDNDTLNGDVGNDTLNGDAGNDILNGAAGIDVLNGGDGVDTLNGGTENDTLNGGNDNDIMNGDAGNDTLNGDAGNDTLNGGAGDDALSGGDGNDLMNGGAGNDSYDGGTGIDIITHINATAAVVTNLASGTSTGGDGSDTILNIENVTGSSYNDILTGNAGNNVLDGGAGNDILNGGAGDDTLNGNSGVDTATYATAVSSVRIDLSILTAQDTLGAGIDILTAVENVTGSDFDDVLTGGTLANTIDGGVGNDIIDGGKGNDILIGGLGIDTLSYATSTSAVTVNLAVSSSGGGGSDTLSGFENLIGSGSNDILTGTADNNTIDAGNGNDTLAGGLGDDILNGGAGTDTASYATATASASVNLRISGAQNTGAAGLDTLIGIENLTGSAYADTLTGDASNNTILGGNGNDEIEGYEGNDILNGEAGIDLLSYRNAGAGIKVSLASTSAQVTGGAGTDTVSNFENITGSAFNDDFTGSSVANVIDAGDGNDLVNGGLGNDTLAGGNGTDTVSYAGASSFVTVNLATGTATGGAGTDALSGFENITGSNHNDILTGDAGDNIIDGGSGNDTINGGAGNDVVNGNTGVDAATYAGASAGVTVSLSTSGAQNTIGAGNDTLAGIENLTGSQFNDTLSGDLNVNTLDGGNGNDNLYGYAGNDILLGGIGDDMADGGDGNDTINGGDGADALSGGNQNDIINGDAGADSLYGGAGTDTLRGGADNDSLFGDADNDTLYGDAGNDVLTGGAGLDTLYGGVGGDRFKFNALGSGVDSVRDYNRTEGDILDLSDLLTGFVSGQSDINNFIKMTGTSSVTFSVNADGVGTDFVQAFTVTTGSTLTGQTVASLLAAGALVVE